MENWLEFTEDRQNCKYYSSYCYSWGWELGCLHLRLVLNILGKISCCRCILLGFFLRNLLLGFVGCSFWRFFGLFFCGSRPLRKFLGGWNFWTAGPSNFGECRIFFTGFSCRGLELSCWTYGPTFFFNFLFLFSIYICIYYYYVVICLIFCDLI